MTENLIELEVKNLRKKKMFNIQISKKDSLYDVNYSKSSYKVFLLIYRDGHKDEKEEVCDFLDSLS